MDRIKLQGNMDRGIVLIHFYLPWGASCRIQVPIVDKLTEKYNGEAVIGKLNLSENRELAEELEITGVPTLVVFRNGKEAKRFVGIQSYDTLACAIEAALSEQGKGVCHEQG